MMSFLSELFFNDTYPPVDPRRLKYFFKETIAIGLHLLDNEYELYYLDKAKACNLLSRLSPEERNKFLQEFVKSFPVETLKILLDISHIFSILRNASHWDLVIQACPTPQHDKNIAEILKNVLNKNLPILPRKAAHLILNLFFELNTKKIHYRRDYVKFINDVIVKLVEKNLLSEENFSKVFSVEIWTAMQNKLNISPDAFMIQFCKADTKQSKKSPAIPKEQSSTLSTSSAKPLDHQPPKKKEDKQTSKQPDLIPPELEEPSSLKPKSTGLWVEMDALRTAKSEIAGNPIQPPSGPAVSLS